MEHRFTYYIYFKLQDTQAGTIHHLLDDASNSILLYTP